LSSICSPATVPSHSGVYEGDDVPGGPLSTAGRAYPASHISSRASLSLSASQTERFLGIELHHSFRDLSLPGLLEFQICNQMINAENALEGAMKITLPKPRSLSIRITKAVDDYIR
jgi:hypothetical protein